MKSQLDARPVYLQKEETITGHFLICYLSVSVNQTVADPYLLKTSTD
jgi:transposase